MHGNETVAPIPSCCDSNCRRPPFPICPSGLLHTRFVSAQSYCLAFYFCSEPSHFPIPPVRPLSFFSCVLHRSGSGRKPITLQMHCQFRLVSSTTFFSPHHGKVTHTRGQGKGYGIDKDKTVWQLSQTENYQQVT